MDESDLWHASDEATEAAAEAETNGDAFGDPELRAALHDLVFRSEQGEADLDLSLAPLERQYGAAVYTELIYLLCHLRFDGPEARDAWRQVRKHRAMMSERMEMEVDLRVALASYFLQVDRKLDNPKLIELKLFEQTQASAYHDELTGLHNYRFFSEALRYEIPRSERRGVPLSLVMLDVDDFKFYNDRNGHETGNVALRGIAKLLTATLHPADVAARYGGEEFALILPATPKKAAEAIAERIRGAVELQHFPEQESQPDGTLTVSVGVATFPADAREIGALIRCADRAMYAAKADGKNLVRLFGQSARSYPRIGADIEGSFQLVSGDVYPLRCIDLSQGGLRFLTDRRMTVGALVEAKLVLSEAQHSIMVTGRVVQTSVDDQGRCLVGARIIGMDSADQRRLALYLSQVMTR